VSRLDAFFGLWDRLLVRLGGFNPHGEARHDYHNVFLKGKTVAEGVMQVPLSRANVLVLGCGYLYHEVILYCRVARRVVGLDVMTAFYQDGLLALFKELRRSGSGRMYAAAQAATRHCYEAARYYDCLRAVSGVSHGNRRYELYSFDGRRIPFGDQTFDLVVSNAVLEHVADLPALVGEMHRVTKKGGVGCHLWHNFCSLSGGHLPEAERRRNPWGHLRGVAADPGVNRMRLCDIEHCFREFFAVLRVEQLDKEHRVLGVDAGFEFEGEELLTPDVLAQLPSYPREEFLTRSYRLLVRREV
jgi:SAM-dependent methyltransferase